jgi:hypothetical protein
MDQNMIITLEDMPDLLLLFEDIGEILNADGQVFFINVFERLKFPVSVVIEDLYVDKVYRDSYYNYFSNKHFDMSRTCKRVCVFSGEISERDFLYKEGQEKLKKSIVGFIVVRPLNRGCIGRTLLDPWKFSDFVGYVRTTKFSFEVLGVEFDVEAFPFMSQDTETMTCAETTIWNIMEYFGTRYSEYRRTLPSEILNLIAEDSFERVLPSRGLPYQYVARTLGKLGFSTRLYFDDDYKELKRLFHYYVESGIPIGVAVKAEQAEIGPCRHSIVCIGHGAKLDYDVTPSRQNGISFINSADMINEYVLIDDNTYPYEVKGFDEFTCYDNPRVVGFVVPLYKRIFLEARDAYNIAIETIIESQYNVKMIDLEFDKHTYSESDNPLVLRMFLTSSRHYKKFRNNNPPNDYMARIYANVSMPRFIWVIELSLLSLYRDSNIFGELIIDATASRHSGVDSLVLVHYPGYLAWRNPNEPLHKIADMLKYSIADTNDVYPLYRNNLIGG